MSYPAIALLPALGAVQDSVAPVVVTPDAASAAGAAEGVPAGPPRACALTRHSGHAAGLVRHWPGESCRLLDHVRPGPGQQFRASPTCQPQPLAPAPAPRARPTRQPQPPDHLRSEERRVGKAGR